MRTLAVRLKQHEQNALAVANWLKNQPLVGRVLHPALPDCPGHEYWKRDFGGSAGFFSFELKDADAKARAAFIDGLKLSESDLAGAAMKAWCCRSTRFERCPKPPRLTWFDCRSALRILTISSPTSSRHSLRRAADR